MMGPCSPCGLRSAASCRTHTGVCVCSFGDAQHASRDKTSGGQKGSFACWSGSEMDAVMWGYLPEVKSKVEMRERKLCFGLFAKLNLLRSVGGWGDAGLFNSFGCLNCDGKSWFCVEKFNIQSNRRDWWEHVLPVCAHVSAEVGILLQMEVFGLADEHWTGEEGSVVSHAFTVCPSEMAWGFSS